MTADLSAPCPPLDGLAVASSLLLAPCRSPSLRNPVLFFKARFERLQIDWNPWLRAFRRRPEILHRPCDWLLQFSSRSQWPIRIAQKLAGDNYRIRLSRPDDVLCLHRRSDHSNRTRHDSGLAPDFLGKSSLITGTDRNFRVGNVTAGRTIDEIHSDLLQLSGELDRLIDVSSVIYRSRR